MNKLFTLSIASLLTAANGYSQTISVNWEHLYGDEASGDTYYDEGFAATESSTGLYVGAGYRQSAPTNGQSDIFLVKTLTDGTSPAESNLGGAGQEKAYGIITTSDNNLLIAADLNAGAGLMKIDNTGTILFSTSYAPTGLFRKVIETSTGDYVACGYKDVGGNDKDFFIVKVNSSGVLIWEKIINGVGEQIAYSVIETANGEYIICGTNNPATNIDGRIIRISNDGATIVWDKSLTSANNDGAFDIIDVSVGATEAYAYTGTTNNTTFLKFIDGTGTETGSNEYNQGFSSATAYSLLRLSNGNILMAGECTGVSTAGRDGLYNLTDASGNLLTTFTHDAMSYFQDNNAWNIFLASNGNVIVCGSANSIGSSTPEMHLLELAISGGTNVAPNVQSDIASTPQDTPIDINVVANDSDSDGSLLNSSITITTQPTNGTVSVNTTTGVITYTPNAGYTGSDSFVYSICDNGTPQLCGTASVSINVTAVVVNTAPIAIDDNGGVVVEGASATVDIRSNDSDPGETITTGTHTYDLDIATAGVQTTFNATSPSVSWSYNTTTGILTCSPAAGVVQTVTLTYRLCDSEPLCDDAVVTFNSVVGIEEQTLLTKVYPNPVKNVIHIETANEKAATAKIISMDGKVVANVSINENEINVPSIQAGTYVLEVSFTNGSVSHSIFIKE